MFRAAVCCLLVAALLFPIVAQCAQPAQVITQHKLPTQNTGVTLAQDHWWVLVVRQIFIWIGGYCFVQTIKYWVWRGKDGQPEEIVEDKPGPWMPGDPEPRFKPDRYPN